MNSYSTEWLNIASQVLENPERFDDSNPEIYYNETIYTTPPPKMLTLERRLLNFLKGSRKIAERCKYTKRTGKN